jgi:hypothetical protein
MDNTLMVALKAIGFSEDYDPPFNVQCNALDILKWLRLRNCARDHRDLIWLCNPIAKIDQNDPETLECRDNFRISRVKTLNRVSSRYTQAMNEGCCGYYDEIHTNPETGSRFMIGFNYGH